MSNRRPEAKRPEESAEAFEAFAIYRDMGVGRNVRAVAAELAKSEPLIKRWCSQHDWVRRCHSYDLEVDRRKRLVALRDIEKMRKRQIAAAQTMQDLALIELEKKIKQAKKKQKKGLVDTRDIVKLMEAGAKLERLNRGEPGEIVQNNSDEQMDLSSLTLDELKQLRAFRSKVRARQSAEEAKEGADDE